MHQPTISRVVIVGGGTAGWITAAVLARAFGDTLQIRLIESSRIGTVGVGEATIPQIRLLNRYLGLDEHDMLRACQGTFKLGIRFNGWGQPDDSYLHAFGDIGLNYALTPFHHYWLRAREEGLAADLWSYSLNTQSANTNRFAPLENIEGTPLGGINYAYHFDAVLYAQYLRQYAEQRGVQTTDDKVTNVRLRPEDGFIHSILLESGDEVAGDLFIDCTGFHGLLIEQALHSGYEDWRHWLPCDRAVAIQSHRNGSLQPYTQATARDCGWQWRIPLQHRTGNGYVYCSRYLNDDQAMVTLLANLDGQQLGEPRQLQFTTGRRNRFWERNCVAIGLAAGFMEPLESTSIHLIQTAINRLLTLFPQQDYDPMLSEEYNRRTTDEYERIRDFLILHYHANQRNDTPFWQHCANMEIPETLQHKIDLFRNTGELYRDNDELFTEGSWLQVLIGQGIDPRRYHPLTRSFNSVQLKEFMASVGTAVNQATAQLPSHEKYISQYCQATQH